MKNVFLLVILTIFLSSCVGTYQKSICTTENLVNLPLSGVYKQLELSNGQYAQTKIVKISKIDGHNGLYNYEVVKGSGVDRVLKSCTVATEVILEFKNYKGMISDQGLTFSRPALTENGFGLYNIDYYYNENRVSETLNNRDLSPYETFQQFSLRDKMEVKFEKIYFR